MDNSRRLLTKTQLRAERLKPAPRPAAGHPRRYRRYGSACSTLEPRIAEPTVVLAIRNLGHVWQQLFAEEQQRIARLLIERVQILSDGIGIHWRESGWIELAGELAPATIGGEMLEMEDA